MPLRAQSDEHGSSMGRRCGFRSFCMGKPSVTPPALVNIPNDSPQRLSVNRRVYYLSR
jgi:hypothetical protein